jgi:hypothetical protein
MLQMQVQMHVALFSGMVVCISRVHRELAACCMLHWAFGMRMTPQQIQSDAQATHRRMGSVGSYLRYSLTFLTKWKCTDK